jgi:hypothetical protein
MTDAITSAWLAEEELLGADARRDRARLLELLAPDFYEIGQSGRRWNREEIIAAMVSDVDSDSNIAINERETTTLDRNTVLLSYLLKFDSRISRRSSVWKWDGEIVYCVFHQGTRVTAN